MKTIYLTFVFLMLIILMTGCGESGKVLIASGERTFNSSGLDAGTDGYKQADDTAGFDNVEDSIKDNVSTNNESEDGSSGNLKSGGETIVDTTDAGASDGGISDDITAGSRASKSVQRIYVFVCGHVNSPGVYEMEDGSRICDALSMAGGVAEDGVYEALDQAKTVTDGQTLYVPGVDEKWQRGTGQENAADASVNGESDDGKVNINSASKDELMTLPGIGESKASDIISYREEHGGFSSVKDIMNIQGIKEGVYNKIKDRITI